MRWRKSLAILCILFGMVVGRTATALAAPGTVLDPGTQHFGSTYAEWSAKWWQWALSIPVHAPPGSSNVNHPLVDLTGSKCGVGQSGPVWYLGGAFFQAGQPAQSTIDRTQCAVPRSKAIFFPMINIECSTLEGNGTTDAQLQACASSVIDQATNLRADLDGTAIPLQPGFKVLSPRFTFTLPPDDILTFIGEGPFHQGQTSPAIGDGQYIMLAPLAPGPHVLHFHGEIPAFSFSLDVTYHLTIT